MRARAAAIRFDSKLVRLKDCKFVLIFTELPGFDSKLVRLKVPIYSSFLYTAIPEFRFQTGSIKSRLRPLYVAYQARFRFQTGSIKSGLPPHTYLNKHRFDSKLVRLKVKSESY